MTERGKWYQKLVETMSDLSEFIEIRQNYDANKRCYFGVYKRVNEENKEYFIKKVEMTPSSTQERALRIKRDFREMAYYHFCEHPLVIPLEAWSIEEIEKKFYFCYVTPYMKNGSLIECCSKIGQLTNTQKTILLYSAARSLQFAHKFGIVHRDIKPDNYFVSDDYQCFLADFGISKAPVDTEAMLEMSSGCGTLRYIAPESFRKYQAGPKSDVYSFSFVIYFILTRSTILYCDEKAILDCPFTKLEQNKKFDLPEICKMPDYEEFGNLLRRIWQLDPEVRPSMDEIIELMNNGKCIFPNTDMNRFESYRKQLDEKEKQIMENFIFNYDHFSISFPLMLQTCLTNLSNISFKEKLSLISYDYEIMLHKPNSRIVFLDLNEKHKSNTISSCTKKYEYIQYLKRRATPNLQFEKGDTQSQEMLGILFQYGFIDGQPDYFNAMYWYEQARRSRKLTSGVSAFYDSFINENKSNPLFKGYYAEINGDIEQAINLYQELALEGNINGLLRLGIIYSKVNAEQTKSILEIAIKKNCIEAFVVLGKIEKYLKEFQTAEIHLTEALFRGHPDAPYLLGTIYQQQNKMNEALLLYEIGAKFYSCSDCYQSLLECDAISRRKINS